MILKVFPISMNYIINLKTYKIMSHLNKCPLCGKDVIITSHDFDKEGNLFYFIHHKKGGKCGIRLYHWDKSELIRWYNSKEWALKYQKNNLPTLQP